MLCTERGKMERVDILTKDGRKTVNLEDNEDFCYNCLTKTTDATPTLDTAVHFCCDCIESYYCLKCGFPLVDGEVAYHKRCKPKDVEFNQKEIK